MTLVDVTPLANLLQASHLGDDAAGFKFLRLRCNHWHILHVPGNLSSTFQQGVFLSLLVIFVLSLLYLVNIRL